MSQSLTRRSRFGDVLRAVHEESFGQSALPVRDTVSRAFESVFRDVEVPAEYEDDLRQYLTHLMTGGSAGVLLQCSGDSCIYRAACPLWNAKTRTEKTDPDTGHTTVEETHAAPTGKPCPIESSVVASEWVRYAEVAAEMASEAEDVRKRSTGSEVSGLIGDRVLDAPATRSMIAELVQIRQLEWRVQMLLAKDFHQALVDSPEFVTPLGEVETSLIVNPLFEQLHALSARRQKILDQMLWTSDSQLRRQRTAASVGKAIAEAQKAADEGGIGDINRAREKIADVLDYKPPPDHIAPEYEKHLEANTQMPDPDDEPSESDPDGVPSPAPFEDPDDEEISS